MRSAAAHWFRSFEFPHQSPDLLAASPLPNANPPTSPISVMPTVNPSIGVRQTDRQETRPTSASIFEDEHEIEDDSDQKQKNPRLLSEPGVHRLWQCPTLAQPLDALPSGLQRFTSVFGMGTGGTTALGSPEGW
jgi:hypothetical protein